MKDSFMMVKREAKSWHGCKNKVPGDSPEQRRRRRDEASHRADIIRRQPGCVVALSFTRDEESVYGVTSKR